jgi:hypothetical protein
LRTASGSGISPTKGFRFERGDLGVGAYHIDQVFRGNYAEVKVR